MQTGAATSPLYSPWMVLSGFLLLLTTTRCSLLPVHTSLYLTW